MQRFSLIFLSAFISVFLFACGEKNVPHPKEGSPALRQENHNMMLEIPAEEEETVSLASYKDSFYNTLYHLAVTSSDIPQDAQITWEVQGGRYYILDDEVPTLKELRPHQRTILFLQKNKYDVLVTVSLHNQKPILKKVEIDLTHLDISSDLKAEFGADKLQFSVGEKVSLMAEVEQNSHGEANKDLEYRWEIKKIKPVRCPSHWENMEPVSAMSEICEKSYEEAAIFEKDYKLENETSMNPSIIFNEAGQYVIYFWVLDHNGNFLAKFSKKFKPDPVLLTQSGK